MPVAAPVMTANLIREIENSLTHLKFSFHDVFLFLFKSRYLFHLTDLLDQSALLSLYFLVPSQTLGRAW